MIKTLYVDYFQKSKVFLFPVLGISKKSYEAPSQTFIQWENMYGIDDRVLICIYEDILSEAFIAFERDVLSSNPMLLTSRVTKDGRAIYVFDMSKIGEDWDMFIAGKYSKLSGILKDAISSYYGRKSKEYLYVASFLYPFDFYHTYAELLDIEVEILEQVVELCDIYDAAQETCRITANDLQKLEKLV